MKVFTAFIALFLGIAAQANEQTFINCKVSKVLDSSYFEESLSKKEYPDVALTAGDHGLTLGLGAAVYSEEDGDQITVERKNKNLLEVVVVPETGAEPIVVKVKRTVTFKRSKTTSVTKKVKLTGGVYVIATEPGGILTNLKTTKKVANLTCK